MTQHNKKTTKDVIKMLVTEGRLDDDTANFIKDLSDQAVIIRKAFQRMGESYRTILDAIASIRVHLNAVLDNVEDVENMADQPEN